MNTITVLQFITLIAIGIVVFDLFLPWFNRHGAKWLADVAYKWVEFKGRTSQVGGYVHNTAMSQYIPPNLMHCVTGTWTDIAGQVSGTIVRHAAAAAQTVTINVPLILPSNSVPQTGAYLRSVELDYEILVAAATSVTLSIVKVVRGVDTAVAVVTAPAGAQTLVAATTAATVDQHKDAFTLTTPVWIDNDEYYFLKAVIIQAATTQIDLLAAVANFTLKL